MEEYYHKFKKNVCQESRVKEQDTEWLKKTNSQVIAAKNGLQSLVFFLG
jgi:hypothetical protein